jgi:hypothetical protein
MARPPGFAPDPRTWRSLMIAVMLFATTVLGCVVAVMTAARRYHV